MKIIPLTQGMVTVVDDVDYPELSKYNWFAHQKTPHLCYAARNVRVGNKRFTLQMHRAILQPPSEIDVDHRDGNGLNNRRSNLRLATHTQNQSNARRRKDNTSGFKGVHFHPQLKRWQARIWVERKRKSLGVFDTPEQAHVAYCNAAAQLRGEFARFE